MLTCLINISGFCDRTAELESYPILAVNRQKTDMDSNLSGEKHNFSKCLMQLGKRRHSHNPDIVCENEQTNKDLETLPPHFQIGVLEFF